MTALLGFDRDRLPDWPTYADNLGLALVGRGTWRTARCDLHGGSDSLRCNTRTGGWVCMSCGAKGGDVLGHYMQTTGADFVEAATALGAYVADRKGYSSTTTATTLSARDAMQVIAHELLVLFVVIADVRAGVIPTDTDWQRFLAGAGRVEALAQEFAA